MPRLELPAPPEIFYNEFEDRKYSTSSRIVDIQAKISERALELLNLPNDGLPRLLRDIGGLSVGLRASLGVMRRLTRFDPEVTGSSHKNSFSTN